MTYRGEILYDDARGRWWTRVRVPGSRPMVADLVAQDRRAHRPVLIRQARAALPGLRRKAVDWRVLR